jgi:hypothetical protein
MAKLSKDDARIQEIFRRLTLLEDVLDISSSHAERCQGKDCLTCEETACPLRDNRVTKMGSLVVTMLDEFRWYRAFVEEMQTQKWLTPEVKHRIEIRVQIQQLEDKLDENQRVLDSFKEFPEIQRRVRDTILAIETQITTLQKELIHA